MVVLGLWSVVCGLWSGPGAGEGVAALRVGRSALRADFPPVLGRTGRGRTRYALRAALKQPPRISSRSRPVLRQACSPSILRSSPTPKSPAHPEPATTAWKRSLNTRACPLLPGSLAPWLPASLPPWQFDVPLRSVRHVAGAGRSPATQALVPVRAGRRACGAPRSAGRTGCGPAEGQARFVN